MITVFVDGPCEDWPVTWPCPLSPEVAAVTGAALTMATEILWARSGRRFSLCTETIRPCRSDCSDGSFGYDGWWALGSYPRPRFYQGVWTNVACGACMDDCSCSNVSKVYLPVPVNTIESVQVDGTVIPASGYVLFDHRMLVRVDGGEWPRCNDLSRPNGSTGTWSVTATYGEAPPAIGQLAVGELAVELAKAIACDTSCQLPQPVQQLTRQGVSMSFLDSNVAYGDGRLGLRVSDLFLSTYNPDGLRAPSRVYSPDSSPGRIET